MFILKYCYFIMILNFYNVFSLYHSCNGVFSQIHCNIIIIVIEARQCYYYWVLYSLQMDLMLWLISLCSFDFKLNL